MSFGWINLVNAVFAVDLIVMSVLGQKKSGLPPMKSRHFLLNLFEQKISPTQMLAIRHHIFWKNLFGRSATTKLVTQ